MTDNTTIDKRTAQYVAEQAAHLKMHLVELDDVFNRATSTEFISLNPLEDLHLSSMEAMIKVYLEKTGFKIEDCMICEKHNSDGSTGYWMQRRQINDNQNH